MQFGTLDNMSMSHSDKKTLMKLYPYFSLTKPKPWLADPSRATHLILLYHQRLSAKIMAHLS